MTGLSGFVAATTGIFIISRSLRGNPRWHSFSRFSSMAGIAALVSLVLWIGVAKAGEVHSVNGLLQRLFILAWFTWVEVMAIRLLWLSRGRRLIGQPG